ncbi:MAG: hypothetical protein HZA79_17220 [Sphingobacteriales bacterium]|nr:hypothetical protein [Sphingobacteriales bacterium]
MRNIFCLLLTLLMLILSPFVEAQPAAKKKSPPPPPLPLSKWENKMPTSSQPKDLSYLVPVISLDPARKPDYKSSAFFIERVEDSSHQENAGYAILPRDYRRQPVYFAGKMESEFSRYLTSFAAKDSALLPLIIRIQRCYIKEKKLTNADILASVELSFDIFCRAGTKLLMIQHISDTLTGEIYVGHKREYESILKKNLAGLIQYLDTLAAIVRNEIKGREFYLTEVRLHEKTNEDGDPDTLFIDGRSYLQWSDYRGTPLSENDAYIYGGLYIKQLKERKGNINVLVFQIEPFIIRNKSWAGSNARTGRLLNNQHYDLLLVYKYALELKSTLGKIINTRVFLPEQIGPVLKQVSDAMLSERKRYSNETDFGNNIQSQLAWEEKIDTEIRELEQQ